MSSNETVLSCRLIEHDKVLSVRVDHRILTTHPISEAHYYNVFIEKQNPYSVQYTQLLLNTDVHGGYLNSQDNKVLCAIRARRLQKGRKEPCTPEVVQVGIEDWDALKLRKVGVDLTSDEAKATIIRLLYRIANDSRSSNWNFGKWDLRASLDFEDFEWDLVFFEKRSFLKRIKDSEWTITKEGFEYFETQLKEEPEKKRVVARVTPSITSKVVETAISDAETLLKNSGATSGVDRIHTALHGHLIAVCESAGIKYGKDSSLTELFKLLRTQHPALQALGTRSQDISKVLNSLANILDALNPLRNKASVAHPNPNLLDEEEALLVINTAKTLLHYLDSKFSK